MSRFWSLTLPTIQNWSCQNCSSCCRQHLIEITEAERQRIVDQNWTPADGVPADRPLIVKFAGPPWKPRYRLGDQPDGACVFLNEQGLCRIHAKFGELAKPLPCRVYPFALHPSGKRITVSLRYSCPSVVQNRGRAVTDQAQEIKQLAHEVVPATAKRIPAPRVSRTERVDWADFLAFVDALDATLARSDPIIVKLLRALFWVGLIDQARFDRVRGAQLREFLQIITEAARTEIPRDLGGLGQPSRTGCTQFRMLVAQYARKDTTVDLESGWRGRWRLFRAALRFARGKGLIPPLQSRFTSVPFDTIEQPFGGIPDASEEILTRYLRVKVQGLHFCGRAYYELPFVEGFYSLALVVPAMLWLARWLAAGEGREQLDTNDIVRAITVADHYHAYSPAFGRSAFRRRVRILRKLGDISKLCAWYAR